MAPGNISLQSGCLQHLAHAVAADGQAVSNCTLAHACAVPPADPLLAAFGGPQGHSQQHDEGQQEQGEEGSCHGWFGATARSLAPLTALLGGTVTI